VRWHATGSPRPGRLRRSPCRRTGRSSRAGRHVPLSFVTAAIIDRRAGVTVPSADNVVTFGIDGPGTIAGTDNGQGGERVGATSTPVHGRLSAGWSWASSSPPASREAIPGFTRRRPGLRRGKVTLTAVGPGQARRQPWPASAAGRAGRGPGSPPWPRPRPARAPRPTADASYSGSPSDVPAKHASSGDPEYRLGRSYYVQGRHRPTCTRSSGVPRLVEWVSLTWTQAQTASRPLVATFVTSTTLSLPASVNG